MRKAGEGERSRSSNVCVSHSKVSRMALRLVMTFPNKGRMQGMQLGDKVSNQQVTLEKAMATHFSTLAWKIPWSEEPGRLQSMGSLRVGHGWATSLSLFTFMHWRRKWQLTPVFLPGESQGPGSLVGCRLWSRTESTWLKWLSSNSSSKLHSFLP